VAVGELAVPERSRCGAVEAEVGERVDVGPVVRAGAHFEVQVGSGGVVAAGAGAGDDLPGARLLPGFGRELREMCVLAVVAAGVFDDDLVSVGAAPADGDDLDP
jgi:hypothetical protein